MADARLSAQSDEALTDGTPSRRLSAISTEALSTNSTVPQRRLSALSIETVTVAETVPQRRLNAMSIEVLVPAKVVFVGWGSPISTPIWT